MDYKTLIREKRKEKGISQGKLAGLVQVSQPFIAEIESGRKKPSLDVLMRICTVLEISLFGEERKDE
ncbi:helix-turn-helix transcriptional regulator [Flavonifractor sp. DFI.6.63]|uniref:Helix-turn-helix transcriptional regulator n=1 Tax=Lawsonibacter hominis TaxID=2763053 RepID=A0A8J6J414_9FIRM|nr:MULTISPECIES: helix-turn-helix transcriptional regulator [Oscillospiraceae]MBS1384478.1 helix-turn-helix transcriptional regulator [Flavonifractor sp.]MDU2196325.1 helix-turn-helix transcriptional regulator [Clostridiales bacterium]MDY2977495.1 helix-turn-helix transcriptional regulator [Oscillospiraceae bacterium]MBC5732326.1 helix-turn-helix transcriptional regulator [Lawsonibacter hominis]MCI6398771.1 helix-turn-helix transcriptional regulator [Lawsonibacter sp.]